jgi:hypothetical protein
MVKQGTLWTGDHEKLFRVISVTDIDGRTWVHYREDRGIKVPTLECREYSCYLDSFIERFHQLPE